MARKVVRKKSVKKTAVRRQAKKMKPATSPYGTVPRGYFRQLDALRKIWIAGKKITGR